MKFKDFEKKWEKDEIKNRYSHDVEKDYWEWEAAISRKEHLKTFLGADCLSNHCKMKMAN